MNIIGIDIGTFSIKVAIVQNQNKGFSIIHLESFPLSLDPNKDKQLEIVDFLRNFSSKYSREDTKYILGLDESYVSLRRLLFPFQERHKILKSLAFELEDETPFSQDDAIFDAKIIQLVNSSADVIAIACPKSHIERKIQLASDCQLNLEILSLHGFALANNFESWYQSPPQIKNADDLPSQKGEDVEVSGSGHHESLKNSVPEQLTPAEIVLDIGHKYTHLLIFKNKVLLESQSFNWGGGSLALALSRKYSIHPVEAQKELELKSFVLVQKEEATRDQIQFSDVISQEIDTLSQMLNLRLIELKSKYQLHYTKGSLVGGVAQLKNLTAYLTQKTMIPFSRKNLFSNNEAIQCTTSTHEAYSYGVAIGLAIEGLKRPKNPPLNLLKDEFEVKSKNLQLFLDKWSYTLKVLTAGFIIFLVSSILRDNLALTNADLVREELKSQAKNILGLKGSKANERAVERYIREQQVALKNKKLSESLDQINSPLDILENLSRAIPKTPLVDINLKYFKLLNSNLEIQGEIRSNSQLEQLKQALIAIAKNHKVTTNQVRFQPQRGYQAFAFQLNVERMTEEN